MHLYDAYLQHICLAHTHTRAQMVFSIGAKMACTPKILFDDVLIATHRICVHCAAYLMCSKCHDAEHYKIQCIRMNTFTFLAFFPPFLLAQDTSDGDALLLPLLLYRRRCREHSIDY